MSKVKPATDAEIAGWRISVPIEPFYGTVWICKGCAVRWDANEHESIPHMDYCLTELGPRIKARIESDRAQIAAEQELNAVMDAEIARLKAEVERLTQDSADDQKSLEAVTEIAYAFYLNHDDDKCDGMRVGTVPGRKALRDFNDLCGAIVQAKAADRTGRAR